MGAPSVTRLLCVLACYSGLGLGQATSSSSTSISTSSSSSSSSSSGSSGASSSSNAESSDSSSTSTATGITYLTGTKTATTTVTEQGTPTGSYETFSSTITFTYSDASSVPSNATVTSGDSTLTYLTGSIGSSSTTVAGNFTSTTATAPTAPTATNTQPCNNYVEFCTRKYSNITVVGCHNSPFVRPGSAASNQQYSVTTQLNDGIRFLQAQIQWPTNGTVPHFCHTSCDILDAGPITEWLGEVSDWVTDHPYDVVTVLLGNGNYSTPDLYVPYIEESGITNWVYEPPYAPMSLDNWPTLEQLIISGKRVVMFLDYMANQTAYPWLMDEFSQMWETPFDPTDQSFPCTVQRPPDLATSDAENRLYLMNHNLNVEVSLLGADLLVPAVSLLNITNNVTGYGSLGLAVNTCRTDYDRPPNVLNVDYYNYGGFPGSVFEVAARLNNVTYTGTCCGLGTSAAGHTRVARPLVTVVMAWAVLWVLVWTQGEQPLSSVGLL